MSDKGCDYQAAISDLEKAGIYFCTNWCTGGDIYLSKRNALFVLSNGKDAFYAKEFGITESQFKAWKESGRGVVQCSKITEKGHRCKNITHARLDPDEWVKVSSHKNYCHIHTNKQGSEK